jgi:hypothetical protein
MAPKHIFCKFQYVLHATMQRRRVTLSGVSWNQTCTKLSTKTLQWGSNKKYRLELPVIVPTRFEIIELLEVKTDVGLWKFDPA